MTRKNTYLQFDPKYSVLYTNTALYSNTEDDLLGHKKTSITDKIISLYQELYTRHDINQKILSEIEEETLEASSALYTDRFNPHLGDRQRGNLEKKLEMLGKDKRSTLVEYWRDSFKIKSYLLQAIDEYREHKAKRDFLK